MSYIIKDINYQDKHKCNKFNALIQNNIIPFPPISVLKHVQTWIQNWNRAGKGRISNLSHNFYPWLYLNNSNNTCVCNTCGSVKFGNFYRVYGEWGFTGSSLFTHFIRLFYALSNLIHIIKLIYVREAPNTDWEFAFYTFCFYSMSNLIRKEAVNNFV